MRFMWKNILQITFPVMAGYVFLGMAFGILCQKQGYAWYWALFISCIVYAGSMQFVLLSVLQNGVHLWEVVLLTLSVNARQIFYGLSFLKRYQGIAKWRRWYMIFSLTDETYSLLCTMPESDSSSDKRKMFYISLCNQLYWVLGSVFGAMLGSTISFDTTGIDFAMTALFTVILVEQWLISKSHMQAYMALGCAFVMMLLFQQNFLLPTLLVLTLLLILIAPYQKDVKDHA